MYLPMNRKLASLQRNLTLQNKTSTSLPSAEDLDVTALLLDRNNNGSNLWHYTSVIKLETANILKQDIYQISWDFFRGFESEEKLVEIAHSVEMREKLNIGFIYAGIIFKVSREL